MASLSFEEKTAERSCTRMLIARVLEVSGFMFRFGRGPDRDDERQAAEDEAA